MTRKPNEIIVSMGEYKSASAPNILRSNGLGPCICVGAIYDHKGFMAHYPSGLAVTKELNRLLIDLRKVAKDHSALTIYLAGGALCEETWYESR